MPTPCAVLSGSGKQGDSTDERTWRRPHARRPQGCLHKAIPCYQICDLRALSHWGAPRTGTTSLCGHQRQKGPCLSQPTCPAEVPSLLSSPHIMSQIAEEAELVALFIKTIMELTLAAPRRLPSLQSSFLEPGQRHILRRSL